MATNALPSWSEFSGPPAPPVRPDDADANSQPPMQAHEVYASIDAALERTGRLHRQPPWGSEALQGAPRRLPATHRPARPAAAAAGRLKSSASGLVLKLLGGALALAALLPIFWDSQQAPHETASSAVQPPAASVSTRPAMMPAADAPAQAIPPPLPKLEILSDAENAIGSRIAADIARWVAPAAGFDIGNRPSRNWLAGLAGPHDPPRLAIAPYDALQEARKDNTADPLRVVMPLYTEEAHFIVRADSPLRFIHQIRGRRINIGPAQGNRALTAATIYERMFGAPLPLSAPTFLELDAALPSLLAGSIDVMVLVDAQPVAWLNQLPPDRARAIRLLALDASEPASRKALQSFLPATVRADSYRGWLAQPVPTLSVMSFLVTSERDDRAAAEPLARFAQALCRNLPALRSEGHPKWREVQLGLQVDVGWPYAEAAAEAFRACARNP